MNQWMDRRTDRVMCRVACMRLKVKCISLEKSEATLKKGWPIKTSY